MLLLLLLLLLLLMMMIKMMMMTTTAAAAAATTQVRHYHSYVMDAAAPCTQSSCMLSIVAYRCAQLVALHGTVIKTEGGILRE